MLLHFYVFIVSFGVALITIPGLRRWAFATCTLDVPDERKVHCEVMPRLGGVAIFGAFFLSLLIFVDLSRPMRGLLAGALVVFVTGLVDDLVGLTSRRKFAGQIAGALLTMSISGLHLAHLGNLFGVGDVTLPLWFSIPFTVFAVVGVTNAINLIDGLDGLSGGISVIALGGFALLAYLDGNFEVTLLCAALAGAILGFLRYNFHPSCIFMGDCGSLVVGFLLAFLAIQLTHGPGARVQPVVPLILLGLPIIDTIWVMGARVMRGRSPFTAERNHVHHKFLDLGFGHRASVLIIYAISIFWMLIGFFLRFWPAWQLLALFLVLTTLSYRFMHAVGASSGEESLTWRQSSPSSVKE